MTRSTPATPRTPGPSISATATRTTTTTVTSSAAGSSADRYDADDHAALLLEALAEACFACRVGKRNSHSASSFEANLEQNLIDLRDDLLSGAYTPERSICFIVRRPKLREVWAASFRDRIVHHLIYQRIAPQIHAKFVADTCACIPSRGTLYAAVRLEGHVRSITRNWQRRAFYLKCDIASFFTSIDKRIVVDLLRPLIDDPWVFALTEQAIMHDPRPDAVFHSTAEELALVPPHKSLLTQPPHRGLPIGNLTSQFAANVYLNVLDQFVKHQLRAPYYVRYVDDFILLHESPQWLNAARQQIEALLAEQLRLQLNPRKTVLQPIDRGIDFVGQVVRPWRRSTRPRTVNEALRRTAASRDDELISRANSYFGLLRQASASHDDRARLAKLLLRLGTPVSMQFTKAMPSRTDQ